MSIPDGYMLQTCFHCGNQGLLKIEKQYDYSVGGWVYDDFGREIGRDLQEDYIWTMLSCPVCHNVTLYETYSNETYENPIPIYRAMIQKCCIRKAPWITKVCLTTSKRRSNRRSRSKISTRPFAFCRCAGCWRPFAKSVELKETTSITWWQI